jgi:hypothetical protein
MGQDAVEAKEADVAINLISLVFSGLFGVPPVVAGPELSAEAVVVEAPIRAVTVYGDHARIVRRGKSPPGRGVVALRLPDLPGETRLDTLRVEAEGARVIRVEAQAVERNRASIDQVEGLLDAIEALQDAVEGRQSELRVLSSEVSLLSRLSPTLAVPEHERAGAPLLSASAWDQVGAWLDARRVATDERMFVIKDEMRKDSEALDLKRAELAEFDQRAFSARRIELIVIVDRQADGVPVEVQYLVPGASWTPVYRIERAPGQDRLTLSTAGQVVQTTGEDWNDVAVTLSTSRPGRRIEVPELLTWTLGEKRDFLPKPVAKRRDEVFALPLPAALPSLTEQEDALQLKGLQYRVALASGQVDQDADGILDSEDRCPDRGENRNGFEDIDGCPEADGRAVSDGEFAALVAKRQAEVARQESPAPAAPPAPPMEAYDEDPRPVDVAEISAEESVSVVEAEAYEDGDQPKSTPPVPYPSVIGIRGGADDGTPAEHAPDGNLANFWGAERRIKTVQGRSIAGDFENTRHMPMDLFDEREIGRGPFGPPGSPAALAGGLDYEYPAVTAMTLKSQPEVQVVPLAVETWPISPFYEVAPGLKETAFLKATVRNQGRRPVLGGAVNIFVGTDFIGQGALETTGPGGELALPLGADEDLPVVRRVVPRTVTEGVFSKEEVTTYTTTIEVRNDKKQPVKVRVVEQVPLTNDEDTKVKVGSMSPKPTEGPDREGIMAFTLDIAPGATGKVEFEYTLTRPAGHELRQR